MALQINLNKNKIIFLYFKKLMSIRDIAFYFKVSAVTVRSHMIRYNISRRNLSQANKLKKCPERFSISKTELNELYIQNHLSTIKIAKLLGCSSSTIINKLKKYKIPCHRLDYPSSFKGKKHTVKTKRLLRKNHLGLKLKISPEVKKKLSRERSIFFRGQNNPMFGKYGCLNPMWKGGLSKMPYAFEFTDKLKYQIRQRDGFVCKLCGLSEHQHRRLYYRNLSVHHIDYNKLDCKENNLITLCQKCHARVNFERKYWTRFFSKIIKGYNLCAK